MDGNIDLCQAGMGHARCVLEEMHGQKSIKLNTFDLTCNVNLKF